MNSDNLPKFDKPPVDEVIVGVRFRAPGFLPTHYGSFHQFLNRVLADKFLSVEVLQPLAEPAPGSGLLALPWPRALFLADDRCSLIQLQNDRLYFNWRRRPDSPAYRSYSFVRAGFIEAFDLFVKFAQENRFGPIETTHSDVHYINHFSTENTGLVSFLPEKVFRVWSGAIGPEWSSETDALLFNAQYKVNNKLGQRCGSLLMNFSTAVPNEIGQLAILQMTATGEPTLEGWTGVTDFHDIGHAAIVNSFAAITTPAMHEIWKRTQ